MNGKKGKQTHTSPEKMKSREFELKISFKVGEELLEFDVDRKLHIPSIDVLTPQKACNMMAENPSIHSRWNVLANQAAIQSDRLKMKFEVWVKERSRHYRSELADLTGKRVTDKMVEESVMTDPDYMRMYDDYLKSKEDAANLRSIALGFGERGERLVNIVSMMKWEKPTSIVKNGNKFDYDDDNDRKAFDVNDKEEDNEEDDDE